MHRKAWRFLALGQFGYSLLETRTMEVLQTSRLGQFGYSLLETRTMEVLQTSRLGQFGY
jgi:hypothetical protein